MSSSESTADQTSVYRKLAFLAAPFLSACICLGTPLTIYLANSAFFDALRRDVLLISGLSTVAVALVLALPAARRSPAWLPGYSTLLTALGVTCWLNSNVLTVELGSLRGDGIDIASVTSAPVFTASGLIAFVAVAVLGWVRPQVAYRALQILLFAVLGASLAQAVQDPRHPQRQLDDDEGAGFYTVSRTANTFIIIYDAFQNDIFQEIVASDPTIRRSLHGFTLFTDTLGVAGSTTLAVPAMLSGEQYRIGESIPNYMKRGAVDGSFLSELAESNYDVAYLHFQPNCPRKVACYTAGGLQGSRWHRALADYAFLLDLSALRALPPPMKNLVFNDGAWLISRAVNMPAAVRDTHGVRDMSFFTGFVRRLRPLHDRPAVRAMHLVFPHSPIVYDENCTLYGRSKPWTRENFVKQATCATKSFLTFLDRLRALGLYHDSLIVFTADHGAGFGPVSDGPAPTIRDCGGRDLIAYAHPLLAIKPPGVSSDLKFSAAPAQLTDLRSTICSYLDGCAPNTVPSVFDLEDGAPRERRIDGSFLWTRADWDGDYPSPFTSYTVSGPTQDPASWYPLHGDFPTDRLPFDKEDRERHSAYGLGWKADFHQDGDNYSRWAVGKRAILYFRLPKGHPIRLRFTVKNWHSGQAMSLSVNGTLVGTMQVPAGDYTNLFIDVPATAIDRELSELALDFTQDGAGDDTWLGKHRLSVLFDDIAVERPAS